MTPSEQVDFLNQALREAGHPEMDAEWDEADNCVAILGRYPTRAERLVAWRAFHLLDLVERRGTICPDCFCGQEYSREDLMESCGHEIKVAI